THRRRAPTGSHVRGERWTAASTWASQRPSRWLAPLLSSASLFPPERKECGIQHRDRWHPRRWRGFLVRGCRLPACELAAPPRGDWRSSLRQYVLLSRCARRLSLRLDTHMYLVADFSLFEYKIRHFLIRRSNIRREPNARISRSRDCAIRAR